jgi:hypothetical protein
MLIESLKNMSTYISSLKVWKENSAEHALSHKNMNIPRVPVGEVACDKYLGCHLQKHLGCHSSYESTMTNDFLAGTQLKNHTMKHFHVSVSTCDMALWPALWPTFEIF